MIVEKLIVSTMEKDGMVLNMTEVSNSGQVPLRVYGLEVEKLGDENYKVKLPLGYIPELSSEEISFTFNAQSLQISNCTNIMGLSFRVTPENNEIMALREYVRKQ